jgi:hypothetical protein
MTCLPGQVCLVRGKAYRQTGIPFQIILFILNNFTKSETV